MLSTVTFTTLEQQKKRRPHSNTGCRFRQNRTTANKIIIVVVNCSSGGPAAAAKMPPHPTNCVFGVFSIFNYHFSKRALLHRRR
jgi:hypothetical protein